MDDWVDDGHAAVVAYLSAVSAGPVGEDQRGELLGLLEVANEFEQLADLVETNFVATGRARLTQRVTVSPATMEILGELHEIVLEALDDCLAALGERDRDAAERVVDSKARLNDIERIMRGHLAGRLVADAPRRVAAYSIEIELTEMLRRAHGCCRRIARAARRSIIDPDDPLVNNLD
jgi:phosphate:Na+ symporter